MVARKRILAGMIAAALIGAASERAGAQLVSFTLNGTIDVLEATSPLATDIGLALGDPFTALALIDESFLSALTGVGPESIALDAGAGISFDLDISNGLLLFDETDDSAFGSGFPTALFDNGGFVGFEFISNSFDIAGTSFEASLFEDDLELANLDLGRVDATGTGTFEVSPD
jgi:hypothetical protein